MNKILVVDDDVDIADVIQIILTNNGYVVESTQRWEK